ncbi:MAG: hypothetical protein M3P10_08760, partial [Actinomycetota bacterium]|nr:hypothetical protein [Actinomycetota bacterium]
MSPSPEELRTQAKQLFEQRSETIGTAAELASDAAVSLAFARLYSATADSVAEFEASTTNAARLYAERREVLAGIEDIDRELAGLIASQDGDPCDLEPDPPLLLLPVRLETRYASGGETLQVRIYPDDVHVDLLDRGLDDIERDAGVAYWTSIWDGTTNENEAWQALVAAAGANRAEWVATALSPDLATRPDPPAPGEVPTVPDTPIPRQMPPFARCLPDRFVVVAVQGSEVSRATGTPVPPELVVGLPPTADPNQLVQQGGRVTLGPGMEWLIDPDRAREVGMLVDVPLAEAGAPVDRVFAFGVRGSLDPADSADELTRLLQAHRYSVGAAFVPPGTPTNNTETDRAAWTRRRDPLPPPTVPSSAIEGADGAVAASALGLDPDLFAPWPGADGRNQPLAAAASTALWQATWGTFIERLLTKSGPGPAIPDDLREAWRDWWQDYVRGRGPLPLLRLGDQPYGLLPVSPVQTRWRPDGNAPIEAPMVDLLRGARRIIAAGVLEVARVDGAGPIDETLLEILGSAPHLLGLRVRSIGSEALLSSLELLYGIDLGSTNQGAQDELTQAMWLQLGAGGVALRGTIGKTTRALGLPLVLDDETAGDERFYAALLADTDRTVNSVLQALLEICAMREQAAVDQAVPPLEFMGLIVELAGQVAEGFTEELSELIGQTQAGRLDPGRLRDAADRIAGEFGESGPSDLAVMQPILAGRTSLAELALSFALPSSVRGTQAIRALGAWFRAQARLAGFRDAASELVSAPIDARRIAVAETLDCASHRYDAWVTSLPARRLTQMRAEAPRGVLLGAYGWVEGLAPDVATTRPGGYVHTPSVAHAATAGVLRSGYLTHNPDESGSAALAVDLSSARVRRALELLEGARQGQPLGALLGY